MSQATATPRHQRPTALKTFLFGVPYYPEHWTPADRARDAALMAKAGVNVVRMAEFAWDRLEPRPGAYDFRLFDDIIGTLGARGIDTMLCTPTATPPAWLTTPNPEWLRVNAVGVPMEHGSRQHCCTNNPGFRAASRRITQAMADHYAHQPRVIGWQTDNELYCHIQECFCAACRAAFQHWLRNKYHDDINALNAACGCAFWAQTYDRFDQVGLPRERPTSPNPGQMLDHGRFLSATVTAFQQEQVDILRAANPAWWITHNGMFGRIDYWAFARELDFLGFDMYPEFFNRGALSAAHWSYQLSRCRAASGNYIVPETQGGAGGHRTFSQETPRPGQMRLWAYQEMAHGADGILHFRWRTCRYGAEMYWNGILDHDNVPRRRYGEFSKEGAEFKRIGPRVLGTVTETRIAALVDQDQDEAHHSMAWGLPGPGEQGLLAFRELWSRQFPVGVVDYRDSFAGLAMIVIPSHVLSDEDYAARIERFVHGGGVAVAFARTATRDRRNHVLSVTPPGYLDRVFGVTVEEFGKLEHSSLSLCLAAKKSVPVSAYEILQPAGGARVVARWSPAGDRGPHAAAGAPGMVLNRYGAGSALYVGTYLTDANAAAILDAIIKCAKVNVAPLAKAEPGVEIVCRRNAARRLYFVLNHHAQEKRVAGLPRGVELISGKSCAGALTVKPFDVAVVEAPVAAPRSTVPGRGSRRAGKARK